MLKKRIVMSVFGLLICGFSVGLFRMALFGVDPFQALMNGVNSVVPLDFGTTYLISNGLLFLFMLAADRHYIGIVTFLNMFFFGYMVDFSHRMLLRGFGEPGIPGRIVFLALGIVVMCFGSAFYYTADLGVSVYDAVSLIIAHGISGNSSISVSLRISSASSWGVPCFCSPAEPGEGSEWWPGSAPSSPHSSWAR